MADPAIVIVEADRLSITGLEQVRSIFDQGGLRLILVGKPGIEKRMARFPHLYSCIDFVHEFRPIAAAEVQKLLESGWTPTASSCLECHSGKRCWHPSSA